jgi:hypothetical protein
MLLLIFSIKCFKQDQEKLYLNESRELLRSAAYRFEGHSSIWGMNCFRQNLQINAFFIEMENRISF